MMLYRFVLGRVLFKKVFLKTGVKYETMKIHSSAYYSTKSDESSPKLHSLSKGNKISEIDLSTIERDRIRNFSIIAHIDHGKSTLADSMLEHVGAISKRTKENDRVLDKLQVERERGITVKAQTASFIYEVRRLCIYIIDKILLNNSLGGQIESNNNYSQSILGQKYKKGVSIKPYRYTWTRRFFFRSG